MIEQSKIQKEIIEIIQLLLAQDDKNTEIYIDTPLLGGDSDLDSMKLVELCLELEDKASEMGFEFDWTSEKAMSRAGSMFRTVGTLAEEFTKQNRIAK